jgi:acyl-CoA synthetase (AMP-forming)/AMP-acid ligase II
VFTSGTTGTPKGAIFAGRQLAFITQVDTGGRWGPGGHTIGGTSLAHLGPMTKLPGNLVRGSTTHLLPKWRAVDALRLIALHRMTGIGGIPTQVALMLRDPAFEHTDLSSLQAVVIGGGPATPTLVREIRERMGAAVSVRYSCTEAGIGVGTDFSDPPEDAEVSVGRPHAGVDVHIVGDDGELLPPGEIGEVCLRSPAVMSGYWRDAEATAAAFTAEGAVRTGDLGYVDDEGRLRLVGRSKEMYVRGGYNVYPAETEAVLAEHPLVAEVAVVPRVDDVMGEVGVAVVVAAGGETPTLDDLRAFAAEHLAHHKLPEDLLVVDALPLTPMDKVDRRALGELVARSAPGARPA